MIAKFLIPATVLLATLASRQSHAVSLSPLPILDPAGAENLNSYVLGTPIEGAQPLWPITFLDWNTTGSVTIEVVAIDDGSTSGASKQYTMFLTAQNNTPDTWSGFEFDLSGPATFSLTAPTLFGINSTAPTVLVPRETNYTGLSWDQPSFGPRTFLFAMDVTAPVADDPIRLTFNPVAVIPEPATGTIIASGLLFLWRRRSRG